MSRELIGGIGGFPIQYGFRLALAILSSAWLLIVPPSGTAHAAAEPGATGQMKMKELVGPVPISIHVPPVRTLPPARTHLIERPPQYDPAVTQRKQTLDYRMESLRLAIEDLMATFADGYTNGPGYLKRWKELNQQIADRGAGVSIPAKANQPRRKEADLEQLYRQLREDALLANPLMRFDRLLVLKRAKGQLGLPTNHQCNTSLPQKGYDNELTTLSPARPGGQLTTVYRPRDGAFVGEVDLSFDAQRILFTMPNGRTWQIHEMALDETVPRQISREDPNKDVDNFDACYLPGGGIVFGSTASFTGVPCWHGKERASCLFTMGADGANVRQLCFDQDLDLHPSVMPDGQVIFSRWDYTGLLHAYVRPLTVMNPDGTGQRALYGSNCYYPNCLFYPRAIPGSSGKVAAILSGYHGKNRQGELVVVDTNKGWTSEAGIVARITHRGEPIVTTILDILTGKARPQFVHPCPLSEKYFLASMQAAENAPWGIYLVDVFDNITPILTDPAYDYFEPIPIVPRATPPILPDRTNRARNDAVVILSDIYRGPGLAGVPPGTVKKLRIVAYNFGYPGMAGPDKIGRGGPWEVMRILGTVPVQGDGSAKFRVPADTPLSIQALDAEDKAVQIMRSWYTAMPGETTSCVGCHESPREVPLASSTAMAGPISEIEPWYGPARGFDFTREVQPVLDRHCIGCHPGDRSRDALASSLDLRGPEHATSYAGLPDSNLGATRLDPWLIANFPERFQSCKGMPLPYGELKMPYTPSYEALIPYIRRVNVEDGVELLRPGEYHADTSEIVRMLQKGHHGVQLEKEAWDRLVTWIDLNGPCHGRWSDVAEIPFGADRRRLELAIAHGVRQPDPETLVEGQVGLPHGQATPTDQGPSIDQKKSLIERLIQALGANESMARQNGPDLETKTLVLGQGQTIELVKIPAGRFLMGDTTGEGDPDEWPPSIVEVNRPFWISRTEITNSQLKCFLPDHRSGYFTKRQIDKDGPGINLNEPDQPAVRVSWNEAIEFCDRLSAATGEHVALPTEAQWEYAARAGTSTPLSFGETGSDFTAWANMADRSFTCLYEGTAGVANLQPLLAVLEQDDQALATTGVASYRPNGWGLFDMHGNAAEWTRSPYQPYPHSETSGNASAASGDPDAKRVVRGGSFHDRPQSCRSSHRRAYPAWQAVHDVGFRIVID